MPDFSKIKALSPRKDIRYRNNRGYELMINNLPWGKEGSFTVKRYRLAEGQDFGVVDETPASGDRIKIWNLLAPLPSSLSCSRDNKWVELLFVPDTQRREG
jgi:hypothetical protein